MEMFIQIYVLTCKGGTATTASCCVKFNHHNLYEITPELSVGFCAHPHLCKQNFRKVMSTFALEVTIKAVFELHFVSESQLGFPGSFLTWRGWYKGKLLGHHIYNSPLNLMLCCLFSDAFPFVPTLAISASSLTFYRIFASFSPPLLFIFPFPPLHIHLTERLSKFKSPNNKLQSNSKQGISSHIIPCNCRRPDSE